MSTSTQQNLKKIICHVTAYKKAVADKESVYKTEIARLETVVASLEAELDEMRDPMKSQFVKTGSRMFALTAVSWGVTTAKVEGGFMVFASDEAADKWRMDCLLKKYPGIKTEKVKNRKLFKNIGTRYMVQKLAPWATTIAKVKEGFIAFPSFESYLHWYFISNRKGTSAEVVTLA